MNPEALWQFVKQDKRTPAEIFDELCQQMQAMSGGALDDKQAIEAVRNLLGFCETIMGFHPGRRSVASAVDRSNMEAEAECGLGV